MSIQNWTDMFQSVAIIGLGITVIVQSRTIARIIKAVYSKEKL